MDMGQLTSVLTARRTTAPRFNLPVESAETALKLICQSVAAEVIRRGGKPAKNHAFDAQAAQVADWLYRQDKCGLILCGTVGNGKTTMMDAIINLYTGQIKHQGRSVGFRRMDAIELNRCTDERLEETKRHPLLAIDDLGTENVSVKVYGNEVSPVTEILYHRYQQQLPTVITTNLTPPQLRERYGERVADRFREMMRFVIYENPSYRGANIN